MCIILNKVKAILFSSTDFDEEHLHFCTKLSTDINEDLQHSNIPDIQNPLILQAKIQELFKSIQQILNHETDMTKVLFLGGI